MRKSIDLLVPTIAIATAIGVGIFTQDLENKRKVSEEISNSFVMPSSCRLDISYLVPIIPDFDCKSLYDSNAQVADFFSRLAKSAYPYFVGLRYTKEAFTKLKEELKHG